MSQKLNIQKFFFLNDKEEATMKVLWNTNKALSAAEIAESILDFDRTCV